MKGRLRIPMLLAALFAFALSCPVTAKAETKITSISLSIDSDIAAGDGGSDVEVTSSSSRYEVDEVEVTNEPDDEWEEGDKPKLKITLTASDGYYFPSSGLTKSSVTLKGDGGTVTSVKRSDSETFLVYVTLDELEDSEEYDLEMTGLEWDETEGVAWWDECWDADSYEVKLYRGGSAISSVLTTDDTSYDFSSYFTKSGTYTFRVRAVADSSEKGSWEESYGWYVTSSEAEEIYENSSSSSSGSLGPGAAEQGSGAWLKDDIGWWYCNADKSYTVNDWQYIDGYWYFFDEAGYMKTGWILWQEKWYYCTDSGNMLHDTVTPDGYYVGSDGAWIA